MAEDEDLPDVEGDVKSYLRASPTVAALVDGRVFLGVPKTPSAWPLVSVVRVGGGDDLGEAPLDLPLVQIDVFGEVGSGRAATTATKNAVRKAMRAIRGRTPAGSGYLLGALLLSDVYMPDPGDARPRYSLTYQVSAVAA